MADVVEPIDLTAVYTLIGGLVVTARADDTVQIGSEPAHSVLLHHPPADSVAILQSLDGTNTVADILDHHHADTRVWVDVLTRLRGAQLLIPAADWSFPGVGPEPFLVPERDSLVHRHGVATAGRVLQARQDAVVVVRGTGRLATAVAVALGLAGLGHVHLQPDRPLRPIDLPTSVDTRRVDPRKGGSDPDDDAARPAPQRAGSSGRLTNAWPGPSAGSSVRADAALLATHLRRSVPGIRVHAPAAHHRVSLVVLVGDGPPAPSLAAELTDRRVPHLAVRAGLTGAVVGPLVLPGRSSCLVCALRYRTEADAGRPALEESMRHDLVVPPTALVCAAAALTVAETLDHIDGIIVPGTVDGTAEWQLGEPAPRRRSWTVHPDCGCGAAAAAR
ncbi:hypothetical protein ABIB25_000916 [Nakamurella sp. UYEF19]|uniref:hypothetical protein n=1 Tax=Nakamurella sp. UYEF19 TaxID=1756392 RepID=UPI003392E7B1